MRVELLHIADCPNWVKAGNRLEVALSATGHADITVVHVLLRTPAEAADFPFAGSPTFTIDGFDLFPTAQRINDLACRVYETPAGLAGLPTVGQLMEALEYLGWGR